VLHKLIEEVLTGETPDTPQELERRAIALLAQLDVEPSQDPSAGISPVELASIVLRTLMLPDIVTLRPHLAPELTVFGHQSEDGQETLVSGIADAVARDPGGEIRAVVDWKSDINLSDSIRAAYEAQLRVYREYTGSKSSLLVALTSGRIFFD
jgi:hypothetical protein